MHLYNSVLDARDSLIMTCVRGIIVKYKKIRDEVTSGTKKNYTNPLSCCIMFPPMPLRFSMPILMVPVKYSKNAITQKVTHSIFFGMRKFPL